MDQFKQSVTDPYTGNELEFSAVIDSQASEGGLLGSDVFKLEVKDPEKDGWAAALFRFDRGQFDALPRTGNGSISFSDAERVWIAFENASEDFPPNLTQGDFEDVLSAKLAVKTIREKAWSSA